MIIKTTPNIQTPFDCNHNGIIKCRGACCIKIKSYWPLRAYQPAGCFFNSSRGCRLSMEDRPIDCLLYPLFINGNNTLVIHHHCFHKKWVCRDNVNKGLPLVDSLRECLVELFEEKEYQAIKEASESGRWYTFETTAKFDLQREYENLCIKYDLPIIPRSEVCKDLLQLTKEYIVRHNRPVSKFYREI